MNEQALAGRLIVAALPGPDLDRHTLAAARDLAPAGWILFDRNLKSPAQVADLISGLRELAPHPVLLAVDQEGGSVNRLRAVEPRFVGLPLAKRQSGWGAEELEVVWREVGGALTSLGFDLDFTPVVDLDDGDGANAIGPRSFSTDPEVTAQLARAVLRGLRAAGVIGCLKHFPGLGGTALDTHKALATSPLGLDELWSVHAAPYRALCDEPAWIMTAHAHFPAVDGPDPLPGTFSPLLLREWLRRRIGFDGVVISDDLEMGAVLSFGDPGERARRALEAGCDLVLFCHALDSPRYARDAVLRHLTKGDLPCDQALASLGRVERFLVEFRGGRGAPSTPFAERFARLETTLSRLSG